MVTKSKLFDIFDVIKDNDLSFCVLCLRNQNETKLVKPKALALFMESFNYKFSNSSICYMCEAQAESALKFVSMVHFAVTIEKIMQEIFNHYHKYHNIKQKLLTMLSGPSRFKRTPFMADVCDCEEMVDVIRDRTGYRRTETLMIYACNEGVDTGQESAACNPYNSPLQRPPDPIPVSIQRNLMDNIILFPAFTNGHNPKILNNSKAVLYKNILKPAAEQVASSEPTPTPGGNLKVIQSKHFQLVIGGRDGVVHMQNEAKNRLHPTPAAMKQPATQDGANGSNVYTEECVKKLLKDKTQNDAEEMITESKRMRVESGTSTRSSGVQTSDLRSGEQTASLRSGEQAASLRSGEQAASLRSGEQAASLRSRVQAASLRSGEQTANLRSGEQTANLRSEEEAANLRSREQAASLRSRKQAASLRSGKQAPNSKSSMQTSKEAVLDPGKVDWEDKIPMDLISFVEGAGHNPHNLVYLPNYGRQILPVDPPFTACITDVRSEREENLDSDDDDLIVVNKPTPCIEID